MGSLTPAAPRVLIIGPDAERCASLLSWQGFVVDTADDVPIATPNRRPDLAVVLADLPNASGLAAVAYLQRKLDIPVLAAPAHVEAPPKFGEVHLQILAEAREDTFRTKDLATRLNLSSETVDRAIIDLRRIFAADSRTAMVIRAHAAGLLLRVNVPSQS